MNLTKTLEQSLILSENPKTKREVIALLNRLLITADAANELSERAVDIFISRLVDLADKYRVQGKKYIMNKKSAAYLKSHRAFVVGVIALLKDLIFEMGKYSNIIADRIIGKTMTDRFDVTGFLNTPIMGKTLEERIENYAYEMATEINHFARMGFENDMSKWDIKAAIKEDKYRLTDREDIRDAVIAGYASFSGQSSFYQVKRLVEDTVMRGMHATNAFYWRDAAEKEIIVHIDEHTCERCLELDGKRFLVHEQILPVHPHCRCMEIPVVNTNRV